MESKGFDDLDAEIIICHAEQYLDRIKRVTEENRIQSKQDEFKMRKTERARVEPSKKPRIDRPKPPSMVLGDDEEDDDDFKPRSLFGGKPRKQRSQKAIQRRSPRHRKNASQENPRPIKNNI